MQLDPRRLAILRAVAEAGGVLAAASALHLTPSAISQHIARLESETGVTLLDRSRLGGRRSASLTPAGRLLAQHASRLADVLAEAERDLATLTGEVAGTVTVGTFPTIIRHLVAPAAASVAPSVRVRIRQVDYEPGLANLKSGSLDLFITDSDSADPPSDRPGARAVPLLTDPYQLAVPRGWGTGNRVEDLLERPWVDGPTGSVARRSLDRIARHYGVALQRTHQCLEYPAALALVTAGLAVAVIPALALPSSPDPDIQLLPAAVLGARRLDLLHRRTRREPSPAAQIVIEAIRARAVTIVQPPPPDVST
jgi:DNA-binding transcriptional LysR family regulator